MSAALLEPELRHAIVLAPGPAALPMKVMVLIRHKVMVIVTSSPNRALAGRLHRYRNSSVLVAMLWFRTTLLARTWIPTPR